MTLPHSKYLKLFSWSTIYRGTGLLRAMGKPLVSLSLYQKLNIGATLLVRAISGTNTMLLSTQCIGRQARFGIRASGSEIQGVNHDSSPLQVSQTLLTEHFLQRKKAATGNGEASRLSLSLYQKLNISATFLV